MVSRIQRVAVLGTGAPALGLAAHLANVGVPVLLLDAERTSTAKEALIRAIEARPSPFFHRSLARLVTPGTLPGDAEALRGCGLVVDATRGTRAGTWELLARLEPLLAPDALLAVDTSWLPLRDLVAGRAPDLHRRLLGMHFVSPLRRTRLVELVPGPGTEAGRLEEATAFARDVLGLTVVVARESPHLIAERVAAHAFVTCLQRMEAHGLAPGDVEGLTALLFSRERGVFQALEDWGAGAFMDAVDRCHAELPEERNGFQLPSPWRAGLPSPEARREADATLTRTLRPLLAEDDAAARLRKLVADEGRAGRFAWDVVSRILSHAARCVGPVARAPQDVDAALTRGFQWDLGPFGMWAALGVTEAAGRMRREGLPVPEAVERRLREDAAPGATPRAPVHRSERVPVLTSPGAEAWDLGDGVLGVGFKTKHNSIDADVVATLGRAVERAEADFRALVLANPGPDFSVGANLMLVTMWASRKRWEDIRALVAAFQAATQRLKYARVPVVAVPCGRTLGGGLELCLGATAVQAAAETQAGLVETEIGLVPGGGGTLNLLWRALQGIPEGVQVDALPYVAKVFQDIARARVSTSAVEAQHLGYFRLTDGVSVRPEHRLEEARARALGLAGAGYRPPVPRAFRLPGAPGIRALEDGLAEGRARGELTAHDALLGARLAAILCGGQGGAGHEVTEEEVLALEQEAFVSLCGEPRSLERMQSLLMHRRVLRN
ncbi:MULTISPECIES: 3-hydroxyacyl-CoA dehydrogenase NAD-binding domain-containing protein [Myxococcaceae]|uniref:3-hydroxyacyl-CoA dehydrogenase n=1 Tax=Corallococcus coralloides TaxID=184914 RepID=D7RK19_CORCK|nr:MULTISPECIES: 3-hydroxyacyl-CoA dehydrogenase NAD-binding domain-containing protein [Myxococcaceae]ADI59537.1 CorN [Corallococcus coralloides]QAT84745.1 3-hydroxyacyl-CoA dehydrogenase [Corallococcus coralloides]QPM79772.1 enoyl-CoA hydratase/isomerase family protein [Myxococcus xanthus]QVV57724.1 CorN [Vector pDPO-mxn116-Pvan-Tpase]